MLGQPLPMIMEHERIYKISMLAKLIEPILHYEYRNSNSMTSQIFLAAVLAMLDLIELIVLVVEVAEAVEEE